MTLEQFLLVLTGAMAKASKPPKYIYTDGGMHRHRKRTIKGERVWHTPVRREIAIDRSKRYGRSGK